MKYPARKGAFIIYIILFLVVVAGLTMFDSHFKNYSLAVNPALIICLPIICLFLWFWFDTYYVINDDKLFYRSAFISGSIAISAIHAVAKNTRGFAGLKAAISTKGIVIKYNKWDDIFISPLDADAFINKLKEINPQIEVTE